MILKLLLVTAISSRTILAYDGYCYVDYPVRQGSFCYKPCKPGYEQDGGPICRAQCPPNTVQSDQFSCACVKKTHPRGGAIPRHTCSQGYEKHGALCYPECRTGYHGTGPECYEVCRSGYVDEGIMCRSVQLMFTWYSKKHYRRGNGTRLVCGSNEDEYGTLCYPKCELGYYSVGNKCWGNCSDLTIDSGIHCLKKSYGKDYGKILNCIHPPYFPSYGHLTQLVQLFTSFANNFIDSTSCGLLYGQLRPFLASIQTFNRCYGINSWNTMSLAHTSVSRDSSSSKTVRFAIDYAKSEGSCYIDICSANAQTPKSSINMGWFRSSLDFVGNKTLIAGKDNLPYGYPGVEMDLFETPSGAIFGMQFNVDLRTDAYVSLSAGKCYSLDVLNITLTI